MESIGSISQAVEQAAEEAMRAFWVSREELNNGWCFAVANRVCQLVKGAKIRQSREANVRLREKVCMSNPVGHYWVEYRGRHYDSDAPQGVEGWWELPIFRRV